MHDAMSGRDQPNIPKAVFQPTQKCGERGLTAFLYQRDRYYCMAVVPSRWDNGGTNVCGAGGRYPSDEWGRTVL